MIRGGGVKNRLRWGSGRRLTRGGVDAISPCAVSRGRFYWREKASPIPLHIFRGGDVRGRPAPPRISHQKKKKSTKNKVWLGKGFGWERLSGGGVLLFPGTPRSRRHTVKCRLGLLLIFTVGGVSQEIQQRSAISNPQFVRVRRFGLPGHRSAGHGHSHIFKFPLQQLLEAVMHLNALPPPPHSHILLKSSLLPLCSRGTDDKCVEAP